MAAESGRRSVLQWVRSISIASRLAALIVAVSVVSLSIATIVGLSSGRRLTSDLIADQLTGLRTSGVADVTGQFSAWSRGAETLAASPEAPATIEAFAAGFDEIPVPSDEETRGHAAVLLETYSERYIQPLADVGVTVGLRDILPIGNPAAIELQYNYSLGSPLLANLSDLDDALDGSTWTDAHRQAHPVYRQVVRQLDLFDLLLVEPDGSVVYSVQKHPDLGTSLTVGPYSGTVIASAFGSVRDDPEAGSRITDLSLYTPAGLTPVGAIANPIMNGSELVGVMVMIYDSEPLTAILTAGGDWDANGFPETAQSYLVGVDGTLRTEPRTFIENPSAHLEAALEAGTISAPDAKLVELAGTTVLAQQAVEETVIAGFDGDDGVHDRLTMTGGEAVSTAASVPIDGPNWSIVTEMDSEIADGDLDEFTQLLVIGGSIFVVLIAFAAVSWSTSIFGPIREMSERLGSGKRRRDDLEIPDNSPVEFRQLTIHFQDMMQSLDAHRADLAAAQERRVVLLREMLPPGVAERVAKGDLESLEEVPNATVVVVVIAGLSSLVHLDDRGSSRELVDRLSSELDEIGRRHGLERIKIVGDAYYAACGHSRPYIDHAPRTVLFTADAQEAIRALGAEISVDLDGIAGIHTGAVMVGMTLRSKMVYDVWGPTVTFAHHLARRGDAGQILISETTRALLPAEIGTQQVPDDESTWIVSARTVGGRT